ncbi:MAG: alpha-L-fucosidase [Eubacteriales bacterium]
MDIKAYLQQIDNVIENGRFKDTWESLCSYEIPKWYKDAKFGIFIHWGLYSVPAFGSEWYPRNMYIKDTNEFKHHIETYGAHKDFGYKDFIPMFKAEKFNPEEWAELFRESGAKYIMPVAEHHDGFQMYASDLSKWNAAEMGPCRDIAGELADAIRKRDMIFAASTHRAEHYWFMNGGKEFDSDVNDSQFADFYGPAAAQPGDWQLTDNGGITDEYMQDWLLRTCEIIDKYKPQIIWFDWWILNLRFKPYLRKLAAYYYNRADEWGIGVAINYKYDSYLHTTAVLDIERGQLENIRPLLWQNDTAIAKNSWGYTDGNEFKKSNELISDLVDIVSKNGCLLLNVGPRSDGTITDEEQKVLREIGAWLNINGEAIYGTTFWKIFGEGPTKISDGAFTDTKRSGFTSEDIRFTYKNGILYAFVMKWNDNGTFKIKSLKTRSFTFESIIENIEILGSEAPVTFKQTDEALEIAAPGYIDSCNYTPVCFKITIL